MAHGMQGMVEKLGTVRGKGGRYAVLIAFGTGIGSMRGEHEAYEFELMD